MDKQRIETVAQAMHAAMLRAPGFVISPVPWGKLLPQMQSEYRAVAHSALVAAGVETVWIVTDESNRTEDEHKLTSVIAVGDSREAAMEVLGDNYGGTDDLVWAKDGGIFSTMYDEYPWAMAKFAIQRGD